MRDWTGVLMEGGSEESTAGTLTGGSTVKRKVFRFVDMKMWVLTLIISVKCEGYLLRMSDFLHRFTSRKWQH